MINRKLETKDLPRMLELNEFLSSPWTEVVYQKTLNDNSYVCWGHFTERDDILRGFIILYQSDMEFEIHQLVVDPQYRDQGIGTLLLKETLEWVISEKGQVVFLEVASLNIEAIHIYEKAGFEKVGMRRRYYQDDDAVMMKWEVKS